MRLISRHILKALGAPFFWGVAALTGMMLLQSLPPIITNLGGKGLPAIIMLQAVALFLPALVTLTMPMAVLVSTLYAYSQLAANLEMVAMYANGISVWRMARPALLGAAAIALFNFYIADEVTPGTNLRYENLQQAALNMSPTFALRQDVLNRLPNPPGYVLRAAVIDPVTSAMRNVTIFDLSNQDFSGTRRMIISDSGVMAETPDGTDLLLTLFNGVIYEFNRADPGKLQQTAFVQNRIVIKDIQRSFHEGIAQYSLSVKDQSGCQLLDAVSNQQVNLQYLRTQQEFTTRSDLRLLTGLAPLSVPAARTRQATRHCGNNKSLLQWMRSEILPKPLSAQSVPQQPVAPTVPRPTVQQAPVTVAQPAGNGQFLVTPPQAAQNGLSMAEIQVVGNLLQVNDAQKNIREYSVEFHQRIAVALSPFCFVLIGMALALKYPGSGIGLVIGGSLAIFLGFYILLQGGRGIALSGTLNPLIAMYTPLVLFTVIGLFAVGSANREMGTARSAGIFAFIGRWRQWLHR